MTKTAGIWKCKVIDGKFGETDDNKGFVQINVEIVEGPDKGQKCTYEDEVNAKSVPFALKSCRAVGFKGADWNTLKADIAKWVAAGDAMSTVEIKHVEVKNGKRAGSIWDKVNSIGRRSERDLKAATGTTLADANDALRRAMEDESNGDGDEIPF